MNTATPASQAPRATLQAPTSARLAGAGLAAVLTLAILLGVNTLASVDPHGAQMAKAQPAASAANS